MGTNPYLISADCDLKRFRPLENVKSKNKHKSVLGSEHFRNQTNKKEQKTKT